MTRPMPAAQPLAEPADADGGGKSRRIHFRNRGQEGEIDAGGAQQRQIRGFIARIGVEIFARPELSGIDENRSDDAVAFPPGGGEERQMTGMQRPHRRYQPEGTAAVAPSRETGPEIGDRTCQLQTGLSSSCGGNIAKAKAGVLPGHGPGDTALSREPSRRPGGPQRRLVSSSRTGSRTALRDPSANSIGSRADFA